MTSSDEQAVLNVLLTERASRDLAQWADMRGAFLDDARVRVSWFQGSGPDFVEASRAMYETGSRSFHEIGAVRLEINGTRALAEADAAVHARGAIDGIEVDVTTYGRLYWRVQSVQQRWLIAGLEMLYHKDTLAPVDPTQALDPATLAAAGRFRPSYRYLAAMLQALGRDIDQELPGSDRLDLAEALLAAHRVGPGSRDRRSDSPSR